jgi:hypothetical protein
MEMYEISKTSLDTGKRNKMYFLVFLGGGQVSPASLEDTAAPSAPICPQHRRAYAVVQNRARVHIGACVCVCVRRVRPGGTTPQSLDWPVWLRRMK